MPEHDEATTLAEHVHSAAHQLDDLRPQWAGLVSLNALEMDAPDKCILGQVFALDAEAANYPNGWGWADHQSTDDDIRAIPTQGAEYISDEALPFWKTEIALRV